MKKKIIIVLIFISLGMITLGLYGGIRWFIDSKKTKDIVNKLQTVPKKEITNENYPSFLVNPPKDLNDPYWNYVTVPFLEVDFTDLVKKNSNTVAWLNVPNTSIDYAVVQADDNSYYLNHSFDKTINKAGWVFADYRNDFNNLGNNTILYGHRRLDNIMFGHLVKFLDKDWFNNKDNHLIKMSTLKENLIYQIVSVYVIYKENYYIRTSFTNDYAEFLETIKKRSYYDFKTSLNTLDKILTLSTCYDNNGKRLVVHAKLIKKETR